MGLLHEINPEHLEEIPDGWTAEGWCAYLEEAADRYLRRHCELIDAIERFKRAASAETEIAENA